MRKLFRRKPEPVARHAPAMERLEGRVHETPYGRVAQLRVAGSNRGPVTGTMSGDAIGGTATVYRPERFGLARPLTITRQGAMTRVQWHSGAWHHLKFQLKNYATHPRLTWAKLTFNARVAQHERKVRSASQLFI